MPPLKLTARYRSVADLAAHLQEQVQQGALLLRDAALGDPAGGIEQFQPVALTLRVGDEVAPVDAEVLQVIPGLGLALRLREPGAALRLTDGVDPAAQAVPPAVTAGDEPEEEGRKVRHPNPHLHRGAGPLSWPLEKLQMEWPDLPLHEKIKVAKHGKRPARGLVLRGQDKVLHNFLMQNSGITPEEVAALAALTNLDPALLKRIASSPEWVRHKAVARNLICHPKMTLPQITKLLKYLTDEELRQLTRRGKVRASVKRLIIKKLEVRAGRL